jgi:hypothetical protein
MNVVSQNMRRSTHANRECRSVRSMKCRKRMRECIKVLAALVCAENAQEPVLITEEYVLTQTILHIKSLATLV